MPYFYDNFYPYNFIYILYIENLEVYTMALKYKRIGATTDGYRGDTEIRIGKKCYWLRDMCGA